MKRQAFSDLKHKNGKEETFMAEADNFNDQHRPLVGGIAIMPSAGEKHRVTLGAIAKRKSDVAQPMNRTQSPPSRPDAMSQKGVDKCKIAVL